MDKLDFIKYVCEEFLESDEMAEHVMNPAMQIFKRCMASSETPA